MIVRRTSSSLILPKMPIMITRSAGTEPAYAVEFPASTVRTVTFANPDAGELPRPLCQDRVQLEQHGLDPRGVVAFGQYLQYVPAIARAQAQHRALPSHLVQRGADIGLYLAQPPGKIGGGVVVGLVPLQVVTHAISIGEIHAPDQASMSKTVQDSGGSLAVNRPSPNA